MDKNESSKNLIDLALDTKDEKWFNRLCKLIKKNNIKEQKKYNTNDTYIALEDLANNCVYILNNDGIKFPETEDEINNGIYVGVVSINENETINKGERTKINFISKEDKALYRMYFLGIAKSKSNMLINHGNLYDNYKKLRKDYNSLYDYAKEKDNIIIKYKELIQGYKKLSNKKWWKF